MRIKHIEVQRYAVFKVGEPEQTVHQHMRIDRAAARFKYDADLSVRFVANVGQNRQLLVRDQLGDLLDQLALLHLVGNLGDDGDPGAAPLILLVPAGSHAERSPAGGVGVLDRCGAVDYDRSEEHTSELQSLM